MPPKKKRSGDSEHRSDDGEDSIVDASDLSELSGTRESELQISLEWLQKKFGRFLEVFLILQFTAGIGLFFTGIFFLVWAVAPTASLQAGSFMLLAFFIIGRALLGIIGFYTENFCLLFSYGVILLATFVLRTIIIMVRLKIMVSPDQRFNIPPLLQAAPGAMATYIEMICAILECLQTFCSFYLCWIMTKKRNIAKEEDETKLTLSIANEVARYLHQRKETTELNDNDQDEIINKTANLSGDIKRRKSSCAAVDVNKQRKQSTISGEQSSSQPSSRTTMAITQSTSITSMPLKGILHQPTSSASNRFQPMAQQQYQNRRESTYTTQTHHFDTSQQHHHHCPAKYDNQLPFSGQYNSYNQQQQQNNYGENYSNKANQYTINESNKKEYFLQRQSNYNQEYEYENEELGPLAMEDYHNNNLNKYGQLHHYSYQYGNIGQQPPRWPPNNHRSSFEYQTFKDGMNDNCGIDDDDKNDYIDLEPRARSPVPPPDDHEDSQPPFIHSPLLYHENVNVYQNYGATANYQYGRYYPQHASDYHGYHETPTSHRASSPSKMMMHY